MVAKHHHPLMELRFISDDHTALTGCHGLRAVEAEHAQITEAAGLAPLQHRSHGFRRIFNHYDSMVIGDGTDSLQVRHIAVEIDRYDGLGSFGYTGFERRRRKAPGVGADIGKNGLRADIRDRCGTRDPSHVGDNHFIFGPDA